MKLFWKCLPKYKHGIIHALKTDVRYASAICGTGFPFGGWKSPDLMMEKCPVCQIVIKSLGKVK